jgi:hypothetical protein
VAAGATGVARNGSGGAVRATFLQGILQGNAAGMSRAAIDRAYREAWDAVVTELASSSRSASSPSSSLAVPPEQQQRKHS